jgi:hypothetical protein
MYLRTSLSVQPCHDATRSLSSSQQLSKDSLLFEAVSLPQTA